MFFGTIQFTPAPLLCGKLHVQQVASEPNSYLNTNRLRRKMTYDKRFHLNAPPLSNTSIFDIWKARFRIFLQSINHELWEAIVNVLFIPTHQENDKSSR